MKVINGYRSYRCGNGCFIETADEMLVYDSTIDDLNPDKFRKFFAGLPLEKLLENLKLFREGHLNLAGLLLFGEYPQAREEKIKDNHIKKVAGQKIPKYKRKEI